jgi:hypothetical protein
LKEDIDINNITKKRYRLANKSKEQLSLVQHLLQY